MDKKDGGTIDLESLRGFTPGPWSLPHFAEPEARCSCKYVLTDSMLGAVCSVHCSGDGDWKDTGDNPKFDEAVANAHLIAAAPSMHAELTARRARDADVEALVASWRKYAVDVGGKDLTDEAIAATANSCADDLAAIIGIKNGCHESDCAVHNAPAYPTGPCDCVLTTGAKL